MLFYWMMSLFFIFMMTMSQIMVMSFHPLTFNMILIFMALLVSFVVFKINSSWFFFLLMLVFLGGVMILIIYMNTLIMNEKIYLKKIFHLYKHIHYFIFMMFILNKNIFSKINNSNFYSMMIYENMNIFFMLFLMLFLLFTLICVVKLVKFEYGPLIKRL